MSVRAERVGGPLLGMILFIASEVMFFGGLFAAYLSIRSGAGAWPPVGTPAPGLLVPSIATAVLVTSSIVLHRAAGSSGATRSRGLTLTIGLGALFLALQAYEWWELGREGLAMSTDGFGTMFLTVTGAHGLHVLGGLVMLTTMLRRVSAGRPRAGTGVEAATYYWHFVDVVWIAVYVVVYLGS